jgi:hypothetical protein
VRREVVVIITCWSTKGGSGTSVVAAALSVCLAERGPVVAVDLGGDLPSVLGVAADEAPGVVDWLHASSGVGAAALTALAFDAGRGLRVLQRGRGPVGPDARWTALADALADTDATVVVDAGTAPLPAPLLRSSAESLLVVRPCFLALRRVSCCDATPTGVVVIAEPGRALGRRDVERVTGVRVLAELPLDPAVARAVDAGLLASRLPMAFRRGVAGIAGSLSRAEARG